MASNTTIQISNKTKEFLNKVGKKGETYDEIICRILKSHEYVLFMEQQYAILDNEKNWVSLDDLK